MKKGILILIVVVLLIIVVSGIYYFWSNSETQLRKNIEERYYQEQVLEICNLNSYKGFDSKQNCENAVKCISVKVSELIKKEDLKEMSKKVKWSDRVEHTISVYLSDELGLSYPEMDAILQTCLSQYGYSASS